MDHYLNAYPISELRTFHCDRVRKMPLSGLDPSMLVGFLCKDEADYQDFRSRVTALCKTHKPIFSIQAEPPTWGDDSDDVGLESFSEPDMDPEQEDGEDAFFSSSPSPVPPSTEDSASLDPVTPGPLTARPHNHIHAQEELDPDVIIEDDDDEWVDPGPTPTAEVLHAAPSSTKPTSGARTGKGTTYKTVAPGQHFPFPSSDDGDELSHMKSDSRSRERGESRPLPHLRSMRARDGGRTQSGGVKGVWTDSGDDF